ncbi:MAG: glutamine--fructose-6-phosphate transaminase (isomerizing) [Ruminococcaceae bacterium]|nr:glutamine--fructose-6-phosphate transaminase (isomerizing) [Oscillospiraceae bacterium]
MCGIIGYTGFEQASPILLEGLSRLEYRGYDSAGLAVQLPARTAEPHPLQVVKTCGRLQALIDKTHRGADLLGSCGIGHTRWATHGIPSVENAHPHVSEDGSIAVVHNGIIENHFELRRELMSEGVPFKSQTDTEVVAHLLAKACREAPGADKTAIIGSALARLRGSYALGILFADEPNTLYAIRRDSPLIVGCVRREGQTISTILASDIPALLPLTKQVYYPEDDHIIKLTLQGISFYSYNPITRTVADITESYGAPVTLELSETAARLGKYRHFMRKEIDEAPKAVKDTVQSGLNDPSNMIFSDESLLSSLQSIRMIACGSAYHACLVGKAALETLCRIPVEVEIASEFRYREPVIPDPRHTLGVLVSQSGETADTIAALRLCKSLGMPTLGIVNMQGSTLAGEADHVFYTQAGPEIAVATTKAYCAQVAALYLLALRLGQAQNRLAEKEQAELLEQLSALPEKMERILETEPDLRRLARKLASTHHLFFIGRGMDHALAMEGSLKLKEVSYIHAEAYAAGELKHGTISLIEEGTPVITLATQPQLLHKTLSNMAEVKARGAYVICFSNAENALREGVLPLSDVADHVVSLPITHPCFSPLAAAVALQLLAYHVSVARSLDPDKPRNLAKSVTVE